MARRNWKPFKEGDKVWLEATNFERSGIAKEIRTPKIWTIPYTKSDVQLGISTPLAKNVENTFSISHRIFDSISQNDMYGKGKAPSPPDEIDGHQEFKVDKVLKH